MTIRFDDPATAAIEIDHAEKIRDSRLRTARKQLKAYTSSHFGRRNWNAQDEQDPEDAPENHYFETVALMNPRLAFSNPTVTVASRRMGPQEQVATAIQHGQNQWIVVNDLDEYLAEWAVDFNFSYAVCHVSMTECPLLTPDSDQEVTMWPEINRISPFDAIRDPLAKSIREVRWIGHQYLIDKEDLVEIAKEENKEDDAGWDVEEIENLPEGFHWDDEAGGAIDNAPDRKQVMVKEIWVRGYEGADFPGEEEGFHGTTFYYAFPADAAEGGQASPIPIRKPQPFYGPVDGPYEIGGAYYVPDDPYHVTALCANEGAVQDLNRHARGMSESMSRYKRLILVDDTDPEVADKIEYSEHDLVVKISGIGRDQVINLDVGGISPEWLQYFAGVAKPRADRQLGTSDMMRGTVGGEGTATESALANQNSDTRIAWPKGRFTKFVEGVLRKVAWYMYHDDRVVFPLGKDAAEELGAEEGLMPIFHGGDPGGESGESFEDLSLKIEVMSMEHTSEATLQRRALQILEILSNLAAVAPQAPYIKWKKVLKQVGDGLNIPTLPEFWDQEIFNQMVGIEIAEREAGMEAQLAKTTNPQDVAQPLQNAPFGGVGGPGTSMGSMMGSTTGADGKPGGQL